MLSSISDADPLRSAAPSRPPSGYRICESFAGDAERPAMERFVAVRFAEAHGAQVPAFMPALIGLKDWRGELRSALGYRNAGEQHLFLERYLDEPVEMAIRRALLRDRSSPHAATADAAMRCEPPAQRSSIAEIGHLSGRGCRASIYLLAQLPRYLLGRGYRWIAFTGTQRVREILLAMNAPLVDLGPADPARLGESAREWGRYYETAPRVMAGWLPHGLAFSE